jgi:ubiquinone/menaquinone biosynthesis C-methylase UbiE
MKFSKFFSNIQETPWYRVFLNPVINEITKKGKLLDIGTGSGKLIQILSNEKGIDCIGVDTNSEMLNEAQEKLKNTNVKLLKIKADTKLPFKMNSFEYITICNVLFHLKKESIDNLLNDVQNLLKENGKIIILTPTGNKGIFSLTKQFLSIKNLSIYIWFYATKNKARKWNNNNHLKQYANERNLNYKSKSVMNGLAQLETITF